LLDPDGDFRRRLAADHDEILRLSATPSALAPLVHRLAGAAGTLGFADVGDIAIELDDRIVAGIQLDLQDAVRLAAAIARALDTRTSA
jgi:HPt (histidine-containing phosphotransfer) domain-containing protein